MTAECGSSFIKRKVQSTDQRLSLTRVNPEAFENNTERGKPVLALAATSIVLQWKHSQVLDLMLM